MEEDILQVLRSSASDLIGIVVARIASTANRETVRKLGIAVDAIGNRIPNDADTIVIRA